jgi:hypothetical protein
MIEDKEKEKRPVQPYRPSGHGPLLSLIKKTA